MNEYLKLFHETIRDHLALESESSLLRLHTSLKIVPLRRVYSWAVPTQEALQVIADVSPHGAVEVGSGTGYWAHLLHERGVHVAAFDWAPQGGSYVNGHHAVPASVLGGERAGTGAFNLPPFVNVEEGGPEKAGCYPERTLMLCWPPPEVDETNGTTNRLAVDSLHFYRGSTLVYIASPPSPEGEGGEVNGGPMFRHVLHKEWVETKRIPLPNWPTCHDDMSVWKRRFPPANDAQGYEDGGRSKLTQNIESTQSNQCSRSSQSSQSCQSSQSSTNGSILDPLSIPRRNIEEGRRLRAAVLSAYDRMWEDAVVGGMGTRGGGEGKGFE